MRSMPFFVFLAIMGVCMDAAAGNVSAIVGADGVLSVRVGKRHVCRFSQGMFEPGWRFAGMSRDNAGACVITSSSGANVKCKSAFQDRKEAGCQASYEFEPQADMSLIGLNVSADFAIPVLAGGKWVADNKSGKFPVEFKDTHLFQGEIMTLALQLASGEILRINFATNTPVLLQDNRKWGPSYTVRIGRENGEGAIFKKFEPVKVGFTLSAMGGLTVKYDAPVTLAAGPEWIPLKQNLDIEPGSALDFSKMGFHDAPAGKLGWLTAGKGGIFAFEKEPDKARRFYGVNLCFSAFDLSHEESDRLAERLMRLGYNALRVHHHEGNLVDGQKTTLTFNSNRLDRFDYLMAALIKRGIYLTTDLYVSRHVKSAELGMDKDVDFKVYAPVEDKVFDNWKAFSKAFLTHVNPYTQRSYAEEPALAWISMINEGNFGNYWDQIVKAPQWSVAWNKWLVARHGKREALAEAWGAELGDAENPADASVALPASMHGNASARLRDARLFCADMEKSVFVRMREYLRKDLRVRALLTNMNGWTNFAPFQFARNEFDYCDEHFYIDHPEFIRNAWQLPSRCPNTSPIGQGAAGGRPVSFTRLMDKPFTITEYNYSAPGRYRGVGGILTGALGSLQGWGGIWRFAYSHSRDGIVKPVPMNYFDMAADPMGQAAERAALCLFLRGDMRMAPHSVSIVMTPKDLENAPKGIPGLRPSWHWAAWITRVGTQVVDERNKTLMGDAVLPLGWGKPAELANQPSVVAGLDPYSTDTKSIMELLRNKGIIAADNTSDPVHDVYASETGEIRIDAPKDTMILNTERTAGGFVPEGGRIETACGVSVVVEKTDATVWASSLDGKPLARSGHILVSHLTDLQNTGIKYQEEAMQTLLAWGQLPHLARAGRAKMSLKLANPAAFKAWALSTGGKRLFEVPLKAKGDTAEIALDVACGGAEHGAVFSYEIVADEKN